MPKYRNKKTGEIIEAPDNRGSAVGGLSQAQLAQQALAKVIGTPPVPFEQKIEQDIKKEQALGPAKAASQVLAQEQKMAAESRRNKNKARLQLIQTGLLYKEMTDWNKKNLGIDPEKSGRLGGVVNVLFGQKLGLNPYVSPFEGDQIETAAALMKIAAPSARGGERLIEMFQKTLPNIWAVKPEAKSQIVNSLSNSIYQDAVTHPEDYPEIDENLASSYVDFAKKTRERMTEVADLIFDVKKSMPSAKKTSEGVLMKAPDGSVEEVPFNKYRDAKLDGYEEIK